MYNSMIMLPQTLFFYNGLISRLNRVSHAKGFIEQIDVLHGDIWRARPQHRNQLFLGRFGTRLRSHNCSSHPSR